MARTRKQGGSVRRLKSGQSQALIDAEGKRASVGGTFDTEEEAHDALREAIVNRGRGSFQPLREAPSFDTFAHREVRLRDVRARTRKGYETLLATMLLPMLWGPSPQ